MDASRGPTGGRSRVRFGVVAAFLLLATALVPVVYFASPRNDGKDDEGRVGGRSTAPWAPQCPPDDAFDCHPEANVSRGACVARGCCWVVNDKNWAQDDESPPCVYPRNYGYVVVGDEEPLADGWQLRLARIPAPPRYGDEAHNIVVRVEMQTNTRLRIKFYDPLEPGFQVPEPSIPVEKSPGSGSRGGRPLYAVSYNKKWRPFGLRVRRVDTDVTIFDTRWGGLTVGVQFSQVSVRLPSVHLYGLGEHTHGRLVHDFQWLTWPMFAKKTLPENRINGNGVHPTYMCLEKEGNGHGVLLLNSHPLEVQLQPTPAITFRTAGGILDFYIFLGPKPKDVLEQYTQAIGRPMMPPYWALGLQISRAGFRDQEQVQTTVDHARNLSVPFDVVGMDSCYLWEETDFVPHPTKFNRLATLASSLQAQGRRLVVTISPTVTLPNQPQQMTSNTPYDDGLRSHIFVNDSWAKQPLRGKGPHGLVLYADFINADISRWWSRQLTRLYQNVLFEGLWLDENEPSNWANGSIDGCLQDPFNEPPFAPNIQDHKLYTNTLCMDATHYGGDNNKPLRHIQVHNLYAHHMMKTTARVLTSIIKKRSLVVSRSTFVGSGRYGGHWLHAYNSTWQQLLWSLVATLEFNLFAIPYVGADICGHRGNPDPDLCVRWVQLGMFYPMARIHHPVGPMDTLWQNDIVVHVLKTAANLRSSLLPYLYTLFHAAHVRGDAVARPLFYDFFKDNTTYKLDQQFMWGPALLISPVLEEHVRTIWAYFPSGVWYDYYSGQKITSRGQWESLQALLERINLHVRGGYVIPTQSLPTLTAQQGRKLPLNLIVALDESQSAHGTLYWDDGETRDAHKLKEYVLTSFQVTNDTLLVVGQKGRPTLKTNFSLIKFESVTILGLPSPPSRVNIGDQQLLQGRQVQWNAEAKVLKLTNINIPITETLEIQWHWA